MPDLTTIFHHLQRQLFPALASELGPLSALDQQFCEVISLSNLGRFTRRYEWYGNGAPNRASEGADKVFQRIYEKPISTAVRRD